MDIFHNTLALFLYSLICLLPLVTLSTARPKTEPPSGYFSIPKPPLLQDVRDPRNHGRDTRALFSRARASLFEKRTPPSFTTPFSIKMRMMTFTTVGLITPVASAARALEDFYSSIAIKAAGAWQAEPQRDNFAIQEGNFYLAFSCIGDSIPWSFVHSMAEKLWECACLGMTELFDVIYMDDSGQISVSISLRLVDGGSSSSSTDFREGSVPSVTSP